MAESLWFLVGTYWTEVVLLELSLVTKSEEIIMDTKYLALRFHT